MTDFCKHHTILILIVSLLLPSEKVGKDIVSNLASGYQNFSFPFPFVRLLLSLLLLLRSVSHNCSQSSSPASPASAAFAASASVTSASAVPVALKLWKPIGRVNDSKKENREPSLL